MKDKILYVTIPLMGKEYTIVYEKENHEDGTCITSSKSGYGDILDSNHGSHSEIIDTPIIDCRSCDMEQIGAIIDAGDDVRPAQQNNHYYGTLEGWIDFCREHGATIHYHHILPVVFDD